MPRGACSMPPSSGPPGPPAPGNWPSVTTSGPPGAVQDARTVKQAAAPATMTNEGRAIDAPRSVRADDDVIEHGLGNLLPVRFEHDELDDHRPRAGRDLRRSGKISPRVARRPVGGKCSDGRARAV